MKLVTGTNISVHKCIIINLHSHCVKHMGCFRLGAGGNRAVMDTSVFHITPPSLIGPLNLNPINEVWGQTC